MIKKRCVCVALTTMTGLAVAQTSTTPTGTPAPALPTSAGSASATVDQDKRGLGAPTQRQGSVVNRRSDFAPLPMNIKIQGEGIKLPECSAESREGEACKK